MRSAQPFDHHHGGCCVTALDETDWFLMSVVIRVVKDYVSSSSEEKGREEKGDGTVGKGKNRELERRKRRRRRMRMVVTTHSRVIASDLLLPNLPIVVCLLLAIEKLFFFFSFSADVYLYLLLSSFCVG